MNKGLGLILVVDDYPNWRNQLKCILREDGHEIVTASNHIDALQELHNKEFDVVILDMRLVDDEKYNVQGIKLLKIIKERIPSTGAVILTGYPDPLHKKKALDEYSADAYLCKVPEDENFDIEAFSNLVKKLVRKKQAG